MEQPDRSTTSGWALAASLLAATALGMAARASAGEPELLLPGIVSTGDEDAHATLSPDGERVFFVKSTPDFARWTVVVAEREGEGWSEPEVAWFSGRWSDADVSFAPDGATIYFVSNRPAQGDGPARPDFDIWRMRRAGSGWSEPERVTELASDGNEWFPNATADGWLYFGSERRAGNLGPPGTADLWRARLVDGVFSAPENLGARLNTEGNDIEPWVSADGGLLVFASKGRADTAGAYDLYASRRCGEEWSEPLRLDADVNAAGWEFGARLTPDGRWLLFTSDRTAARTPAARQLSYRELLSILRSPGNGLKDVYRVEVASLTLPPPCAAPGAQPVPERAERSGRQ